MKQSMNITSVPQGISHAAILQGSFTATIAFRPTPRIDRLPSYCVKDLAHDVQMLAIEC